MPSSESARVVSIDQPAQVVLPRHLSQLLKEAAELLQVAPDDIIVEAVSDWLTATAPVRIAALLNR